MTETTRILGQAQDDIREAARKIADVSSHLTDGGQWGTQRMEYLATAISCLNYAFSLARACTNESPVSPSVRPPLFISKTQAEDESASHAHLTTAP